jgi:Asp-tRNA(Asn)/Glu-tRNA(Gln) amidotransferase A subunit family amidase
VTEAEAAGAREVVGAMGRELAVVLAGADALVLPTITEPPPLCTERDSVPLVLLTLLFNALGWPALAVPARAARGGGDVPPSVQLVAGPGAEERLLGLGAELPTQRTATDAEGAR